MLPTIARFVTVLHRLTRDVKKLLVNSTVDRVLNVIIDVYELREVAELGDVEDMLIEGLERYISFRDSSMLEKALKEVEKIENITRLALFLISQPDPDLFTAS